MIKIENVEVLGWDHAIRGMRNPKNSWDRSDSLLGDCESMSCSECWQETALSCNPRLGSLQLGPNDHKRAMNLAAGGPVHAKYRRMITVYLDITAPLYWWKEFDTYKVGTVANSCSTMHKIHAKEFDYDDFSYDHLLAVDDDLTNTEDTVRCTPKFVLQIIIDTLNYYREQFNIADKKLKRSDLTEAERKHTTAQKKRFWWQMIQLLPSSYNQKRTVMLNYEVLAGIYPMRKNHKLDEWVEFCKWIESLPYSEIIIGDKDAPKKDTVEVCRCKDCKYYLTLEEAENDDLYEDYPFDAAEDIGADGLCMNTDKWTTEDRFCSDGTKKKAED